ncbi:MAG: hypothetical protein ACQES2_06080 [Pseudomonadota bacterium]
MSDQDKGKNKTADRRFAVSTHRGGARHRVRYVERGGGTDDSDECRLCQPVVEPRGDGETDEDSDSSRGK